MQVGFLIDEIDNWENYIWATTLVESRAVPLEIDGSIQLTLIPLAVTPSHNSNARLNFKFNRDGGYLSVSTLTPYGKNAKISHCYSYSTHQLFLEYGTVIEGNEEETLPIELGLTDELSSHKAKILSSRGLSLDHLLKKGKLSSKLFASLRICVLNNEELEYFEQRGLAAPVEFINLRNETQMLQTLSSLFEIMLSAFTTSVEEDRIYLTQFQPQSVRNAIIFRMDQKEILLSSLLSTKYTQ